MDGYQGDVTNLAYQAISSDDLLLERYADPEAVLDYLRDGGHFRTLSEQLKETMADAGVCARDTDTAAFVEALYTRLVRQDESVGRTEKRPRNSVRRWLNGQFRYIRQRRDVIEICFALGLTLPQAGELLNKCGFSGLNARRAEDAVFLYCLLAKRPYAAALRLLAEYESAPADTPAPAPSPVHSGQTTLLLEADLMNAGRWTSDEVFLHTYLLPNRSRFIAFSVTTRQEYIRLKNQLYLIAVGQWLRDETAAVREKLLDDDRRERYFRKYGERLPAAVSFPEVSVTFGLQTALRKYAGEGPVWQSLWDGFRLAAEAGEGGRRAENNAPETFGALSRYITGQMNDPAVQETASRFLSEILSADRVLFRILPSVIGGDDSRKRAYGDSSLKDTVLRKFPHRQTFTDFERDPAAAGQDTAVRKAIILMYYISYAYEFRQYLNDYAYRSPLFGDKMGFAEFMADLNRLLKRCRLSPLYPADQFDWLILRSIREFEIGDPDEEEDNPIAFFNDVLDFSFGEEDTEE